MDAEHRAALAELEAKNQKLSEQIRRLIRTEIGLYRSQRRVDAQLRRINALNTLALEASRTSDPKQILGQAADTLLEMFPFEQVLGMSCDTADHVSPTIARTVPGRESTDATWPVGFVLGDDERALLTAPIVCHDGASESRTPGLARILAVCEAVFPVEATTPVFYTVLPLCRRRRSLLGVMVARRVTPMVTFHDQLPDQHDAAFLQLFAHHVENAVENAALIRDLAEAATELEARVQARTSELGEVNSRLDANLRQLRETQDQLVLAGKMAAIGTLVAGLSHELNNPLSVILASAQVLLEQADPGASSRRPLQAIERQALRCARLVQTLLDFSRQRESVREPIAAALLFERVAQLSSGQAHKQVRLAFMPALDLPVIDVCATEIESALLNLVTNGCDATAPGGTVEVSAASIPRGDRAGVQFAVRDTGQGIPPEVLPRIFDPFFTTKGLGKGTGLGLSLTRTIVTAHDGHIEVDTRVGEGTEIRIWLPTAGDGR